MSQFVKGCCSVGYDGRIEQEDHHREKLLDCSINRPGYILQILFAGKLMTSQDRSSNVDQWQSARDGKRSVFGVVWHTARVEGVLWLEKL